MNLDQQIARANLSIQAANNVLSARLGDWTAALLTGGQATRQTAFDAVLAATEAVLDSQAFHADLIHKANGTTPQGA